MKIEKITENKIRIILKQEDFKDKSIDIQKLLLTTPDSQNLFLEILDKAKKEINFDTDGQKLLIEMSLQTEDVFIFTITKYRDYNKIFKITPKRYLTVKRKNEFCNNSSYIYQFNKFDNFCNFCDFIHKKINIKELYKTSILYFYNETYYLVINEINKSNKLLNLFHSSLLEFSDSFIINKYFKFKLEEHGKIIMKNNAIITGIKHFSK
mgnify:CR=1 FL=1